jgi:hypothetical protein
MRRPLALALAGLAAGCVAPADASTTCGDVKLDRPLLVLEWEASGPSSGLGRIDEGGCFTEVADLALGGDPALCAAHDRPFVCARDRGLVLEIDPADAHIVRTIKAYRDGEAQPCGGSICANPHGVDVDASGRLWVSRYDQSSLAVLQPSGAWSEGVDLTAQAGPTGMPQMDAIRIDGGKAFVALQRLPAMDCVPPTVGRGEIAVVDVAAPHGVTTFQLQGHNPNGAFVPDGSDPSGSAVTIATPGSYADGTSATDGVERVDLTNGTSQVILSERALGGSGGPGGSIIEAVVVGPTEGYAIAAEADSKDCHNARNATWLVRFDPSSGQVTGTLADTRTGGEAGFYYSGLAVDGTRVVLGDRSPGAARLRFFDRESLAPVGEITPQRLPPTALFTVR